MTKLASKKKKPDYKQVIDIKAHCSACKMPSRGLFNASSGSVKSKCDIPVEYELLPSSSCDTRVYFDVTSVQGRTKRPPPPLLWPPESTRAEDASGPHCAKSFKELRQLGALQRSAMQIEIKAHTNKQKPFQTLTLICSLFLTKVFLFLSFIISLTVVIHWQNIRGVKKKKVRRDLKPGSVCAASLDPQLWQCAYAMQVHRVRSRHLHILKKTGTTFPLQRKPG